MGIRQLTGMLAAFAAGGLVAAFASAGGVGASFVQDAEASASIQVADHLDGLDTGCTLKISFNGHEIDLGSLFDPSHYGKDDGHGKFSATFDFDLFSPDTDDFDVDWDIVPTGGLHADWTHHGKGISITFWWLMPPKGHHVKGSASLKFQCSWTHGHHGDGDGDGGSGDHDHPGGSGGDGGWKSKGLSANTLGSVSSLSANLDSAPSGDTSDDAAPTTDTFSLQAVIDVAGDEQTDPGCDTSTAAPDDPDPTDPADCTAAGTGGDDQCAETTSGDPCPSSTTCDADEQDEDGNCPSDAVACAEGQILQGNDCVTPPSDPVCTGNQVLTDGVCVDQPAPQTTCGENQTLVNGACVDPAPDCTADPTAQGCPTPAVNCAQTPDDSACTDPNAGGSQSGSTS